VFGGLLHPCYHEVRSSVSTSEKKAVTAEELLKLPDDGYRYELFRGELRRMARSTAPVKACVS